LSLSWVRQLADSPHSNFANNRFASACLPLAGKLVAFGKCALIQSVKARSETSMNERCPRLDNDRNLIAVAVAEPKHRRQRYQRRNQKAQIFLQNLCKSKRSPWPI
jgi:hypothetical protein